MSERRVRAPSVADGSWPSEADRRQLRDALRSVIAAAGDFQFNLEPLPPRLLLCPGSECLELAVGRAYRLVGLDEPDPAHPSEGAGPAGVLGLVDRVARAWCVERGVALDTPIERDDPHLLAAATVIGLGVAGVNAAAELSRLALTDRTRFGETDRGLGVVRLGELSVVGMAGVVRPS